MNKKKILITTDSDSCGMGFWMTYALNNYTEDYEAIHLIGKEHPLKFPYEYLFSTLNNFTIKSIIDSIDFIQLMHTNYKDRIGELYFPKSKIWSMYHTGFHYRNCPASQDKEDTKRNLKIVFATPDLCRFNNKLIPLKYPIDSESLLSRKPVSKDLVSHSPSDPNMKNSLLIENSNIPKIVEGYGYIFKSTREISWKESLALKERSLIYIDHLYEPYNSFGISSVEASLLGAIPIGMGNYFNVENCPYINVNTIEELEYYVDYYLSDYADWHYKSLECKEWSGNNFSLRSTASVLKENYDRLF